MIKGDVKDIYDVRGNLLTETQGDVVKTYAYDANGNRTSFVLAEGLGEAAVEKQNLTYSYDTVGRLMRVTNGAEVTAYTYDADGRLIVAKTCTSETAQSFRLPGGEKEQLFFFKTSALSTEDLPVKIK